MEQDVEADRITNEVFRKYRILGRGRPPVISVALLMAAYPISLMLGFNSFVAYLGVAITLIAAFIVIYLYFGHRAQREISEILVKRAMDRLKGGR